MKDIIAIVNKLQETSGTNDKVQIIKDNANNETFVKLLKYTYADDKMYGFSDKKLRKALEELKDNPPVLATRWKDGFVMLDELASSNINDNMRELTYGFILSKDKDEQELWIRVLTKDLRCKISGKTINKAIPNCIREFKIQQAYPIDKYFPKKNEWHVLEEKLNGINGSVLNGKFLSRQGKEITGLNHIIEQLNQLSFNGYYFNGELVRKNTDNISNGDNFRLTTSIVNSDNIDKSCIDFIVFDLIPVEEFYDGTSKLKYKDRLAQLKQLKEEATQKGLINLDIPEIYYEGEDISNIYTFLDMASDEDKEGLMYIKNCNWKNKRHSGILKVKKFLNADCKIIGYEEGTGAFEGKLGSFIIDYKGNKVGVGSGYTEEERIEFWNNRDEYIGRILQVKFKEETKDKKTGLISIQFPIYQCIREVGKEVSYNG